MKQTSTTEHDWVCENIPWLVNGTIDTEDRLRMNTHLEECASCQRVLLADEELAKNMLHGPTVEYAPHESLRKLKAQRAVRATTDASETDSGFWPKLVARPQWLVGAIAAQALIIALLLGQSGQFGSTTLPNEYETLSQRASGELAQAHLQVQFRPTATTAEIRSALDQISGRIISGPSVAGVFAVVLDSKQRQESLTLEQAADRLTQLSSIQFVAVRYDEGSAP